MIISTLVLLFKLQYPFRSSIGVSATAWRDALDHVREMETGPMTDMHL